MPEVFRGANAAIDLTGKMFPSVQLDLDGNLTYRGDGTFKVYINGHPVANGTEKLRQLPTNRIDKIEVITNPSAKYDAERNCRNYTGDSEKRTVWKDTPLIPP